MDSTITVKKAPPVPIKTYKWEDIRRAKKLGRYPYTYLYKGRYSPSKDMENDNNSEIKTDKPKKVIKKVKKVKRTPKTEQKKEEIKAVEQLVTEETEIIEIKLKEEPDIEKEVSSDVTEQVLEDKTEIITTKDVPEQMDLQEIVTKTDEVPLSEDNNQSFVSKDDAEPIETDTIVATVDNVPFTEENNKTIVVKDEVESMDQQENVAKTEDTICSEDVPEHEEINSSKATDSEDTFTESNIEQYLDKDEPSEKEKVKTKEEKTEASSLNLSDRKRKHSNISEMTKSNLSLFEKIKTAKIKAPTFKIPKFRKLRFNKKASVKKLKPDVEVKTIQDTQTKRKSESPVYIHIPLNPTKEQLEEEERQNRLRNAQSTMESYPKNGTNNNFDLSPSTSKSDSLKTSKKINKKLNKKDEEDITQPIQVPEKVVKSKDAIKKVHSAKNKTNKKDEYKLAIDIKKIAAKIRNIRKKNKKLSTIKKSISETEKPIQKQSSIIKKSKDSPEYIHIPLKVPLQHDEESEEQKINEFETQKIQEEALEISKDNITETEDCQVNEQIVKESTETVDNNIIDIEDQQENVVLIETKEDDTTKEDINKCEEIIEQKSVQETYEIKKDNNIDKDDEIDKQIDKMEDTDKTEEVNENKTEEIVEENKKEDEEDEEINKQPEQPTAHAVESVLRLTSSNISLDKKAEKKETLLTRIKSIKQKPTIEKKSSFSKKIKETVKPKAKTPEYKMSELIYYPGVRHKDSIVDYIHIPLKASEQSEPENAEQIENNEMLEMKSTQNTQLQNEEEIPTESVTNVGKDTEDVAKLELSKEKEDTVKQKTEIHTKSKKDKSKEKIVSKLPGFKVGLKTERKSPPLKKKTIKKVSPPSEKKPIEKNIIPHMGVRREDSIVEYIYIPLHPTEEELKEEQKQREEEQPLPKLEEVVEKPVNISTGAVKKKSKKLEKSEKPQKPKQSKLVEDIKKIALKLKEMKKKSEKPTFKTFKRSSKKISPPITKKTPLQSADKKTSFLIKPRRSESPVEYIFIPLNPTPEQLRLEEERERLRMISKQAKEDEEMKKLEAKQKKKQKKTNAKPIKSKIAEKQKKELKIKELTEVINQKENDETNDEKKHTLMPLKSTDLVEKPLEIPTNVETIEMKETIKEDENKPEKEIVKSVTDIEVHHYEPLSKEDEEDGLKIGISTATNKVEEKETVKSIISILPENSIAIEVKKSKKELDTNVYETIQIKNEENFEQNQKDLEKWSKVIDHEYEPVSPPQNEIQKIPNIEPVEVSNEEQIENKTEITEISIPTSVHVTHSTNLPNETRIEEAFLPNEERFLRIPLDNELIVPTVEEKHPIANVVEIKNIEINAQVVEEEPEKEKIQEKLKNQAERIKNKVKQIKRPTFTIPKGKFTQFKKPKFETPKFSMPKLPNKPKINLPTLKIPKRKKSEKKPALSTEESFETKTNIFDFRTYPRMFDNKKKKKEESESSTVPRPASRKKGPIGSRWVHRFKDIQFADEDTTKSSSFRDELDSKDRGTSLERQLDFDLRYEQALQENENEIMQYERENQIIYRHSPYNDEHQDFSERWTHGSFHLNRNNQNDENAPEEKSSLASSEHRTGVLEEIDSDQFFLRQKGISEENIEVGLYLSSEIRDAFRKPDNTLNQIERNYDLNESGQFFAKPNRPKRKNLKKTKKLKKTPHASSEDIGSINTEPDDFLPIKKTRKYKKTPQSEKLENLSTKSIPSSIDNLSMDNDDFPDMETIDLTVNQDEDFLPQPTPRRPKRNKILLETSVTASQNNLISNKENERLQESPSTLEEKQINEEDIVPNIIGFIEKDLDVNEQYNNLLKNEEMFYENEIMKNIEQPEIIVYKDEDDNKVVKPRRPKRRNKSLKSLNFSENDSIMDEFNKERKFQDLLQQELNLYQMDKDYIVPNLEKQVESEPPTPPSRTRSRSRESQSHREAIEEVPCVQEFRDYLGYAIIDKSQKHREPPLPSSYRPKRPATVPRPSKTSPPVRPKRNYSTLGPQKSKHHEFTTDDKENIDISQYIEIEDDDHSRNLQSGEIINKMKSRPLPAPPRPPRKTRDHSKETFKDITHSSNVLNDKQEEENKINIDISPASQQHEAVEEIEVSTQTDPLPDDFTCEDFIEEPTDIILVPRRKKSLSAEITKQAPVRRRKSLQKACSEETIEAPSRRKRSVQSLNISRESNLFKSDERPSSPNALIIERRINSPIEDETLTHASLLVKPVPQYPEDSFVSQRFGSNEISSSFHCDDVKVEEHLDEFLNKLQNEHKKEIEKEMPTLDEQESDLGIFKDTLDTETNPIVEYDQTVIEKEFNDAMPIPEKPARRKSQSNIAATDTKNYQIVERIVEKQIPFCVTPGSETEVEVVKAQRLQVAELDVEKLNVASLEANKILVSEIDGINLQISEITSKSGNLVLNGLEISQELIQGILEKIQSSASQVASDIILEENVSNSREFTEKSTEEIATQTSLEKIDSSTHLQVSTQTSLEDDNSNLLHFEFSQSNLEEEEEELGIIPEVQETFATQIEEAKEKVRLPSPTIVVDPPQIVEQPEEENEEKEEDAIAHIRERIRFIEEEMSEFISDFTSDEIEEIKSEIEEIISVASENVRKSRENINNEDNEIQSIILPQISDSDITEQTENILEPVTPITESTFSVEQLFETLQQENENINTDAEEPEYTDTIIELEIPSIETKTITTVDNETIKQHETFEYTPEKNTDTIKKNLDETKTVTNSEIPKEFHELKIEQEQIYETIQQQLKQGQRQEQEQSQSSSSSSPSSPSHLRQENFPREMPYHITYYPEYIHSVPPQHVYSFRHHVRDYSEEDEESPVFHRRRRHHRHYSRSSSDADEDRGVPCRRQASTMSTAVTTALPPDPTIRQIFEQLLKSILKCIHHSFVRLASQLETSESRFYLQVALVIILVLVAGLILIGFNNQKTIHLHHWDYFNPPKEL